MPVEIVIDGRTVVIGDPVGSEATVVSQPNAATVVAGGASVAPAPVSPSATAQPTENVVELAASGGTGDLDGARSIRKAIVAANAIGAPRVATLNASGEVVAFDQATAADCDPIGVTETAASAGAPTTVVLAGILRAVGAGWTPGRALFAAAGGTLSHTPPSSGWSLIVAVATTADEARVSLEPGLRLS